MRDDGRTGRVFLSYRRQESAWPARQIYELLVDELGAARVFKDVDDIAPGDDFVERIQSAVGSCDVLLALIGPAWGTILDEHGRRRLDDPDDFVRLEVETALNRPDVRVIPILIDNARMPSAAELPPGLVALPRRQAVEINPVSFDTRRLVATVRRTLAGEDPESGEDPRPPVPFTAALGTEPAPDALPVRASSSSRPVEARRPSTPGTRLRAPLVVAPVAVLVTILGLVLYGWVRDGATGTAGANPSPSTQQVGLPSGGAIGSTSSPTASPTPVPVTGPVVVAHRGGYEKFPLETRESLTDAARAGFAVETDVRWTKDGKAVIVHDEDATLGVVCDKSIRVSRTTWNQLRAHCRSEEKDGRSYPIATYASVMDALSSESAWSYVEVKTDQDHAQNAEFVDRIRGAGLSATTVVTSTDPARLEAVRHLAPELKYLQFVREQVPAKELRDRHLWGVAVRYNVATKDYVTSLKKVGLVVVVWTLNDATGWKAARAAGAEKVLTDKPRAYAEWLGKQ
jgi:glycerophosphoryl diester phosphodiesterase